MIIGEHDYEREQAVEWDWFSHNLFLRHGEYFDQFSVLPRESIERPPKCLMPGYVEPVPNKIIDTPDPHPEIKPFKHRAIGWITEEDLEELNK